MLRESLKKVLAGKRVDRLEGAMVVEEKKESPPFFAHIRSRSELAPHVPGVCEDARGILRKKVEES